MVSAGTYEKIIKMAIDNECISIINGGIEEILSYLNKNLDLGIPQDKEWEKFADGFHRRNIIIHNNNIPDRKYISKTKYKGPSRQLEIEQYYLEELFNLFEKYSRLIENKVFGKFKE
jgi:hypothetical protein